MIIRGDISRALLHRSSRTCGFTLVLTLIVLAAITLLVLGIFANVTSESSTAINYDNAFRAQMAVRSGLSRVEALLRQGTWSDDYLVLECMQAPTAAGVTPTEEEWRRRKPVLLLARANVMGDAAHADYTATWEYLPLTSGVKVPPSTNGSLSLPTSALNAREDPVIKSACQVAAGLPKRLPWQPPQDSFWEVIYEDRDEDGDPKTPAVKVPVSRYCFQVEDLQGLLSLDHAGNAGDEIENGIGTLSHPHERESLEVVEDNDLFSDAPRQWYAGLAPGLRTPDDNPQTNDRRWSLSQVALYSLIDPVAETDTTLIDNHLLAARNMARRDDPTQMASLLLSPDAWKTILLQEDMSNPWPTWLQRHPMLTNEHGEPLQDTDMGRLMDSPARRLEENTITGLRSYYECPLIPVEPGVFAYPRSPKMNLNRVLVQVQQHSLSPDEAVKRIANHIQKHLPTQGGTSLTLMDGFAKRGGAFPYVEATPSVNAPAYLQNLAASIIDYADKDCVPILKEGLYRGFDSAPVIHEHFLMHRWESSTIRDGRRIIRYSTTFFFELWNMSNRPVRGEFEAEYINQTPIQVGARNHVLDQAMDMIVENKPYADGSSRWMPLYPPHSNLDRADPATPIITLRPNEMRVIGSLPITYEFDAGPASVSISEVTAGKDNTSRLHIRFRPTEASHHPDGLLTDVSRSTTPGTFVSIESTGAGVERNPRYLKLASPLEQQQFCCNPINFSTGDSEDINHLRNNHGDPRASFYLQDVLTLAKYGTDADGEGGASPWGRNKRQNVSSGKIYGEVFVSRWGDRGHDGPTGVYPANNACSPFAPSVLVQRPLYTIAQSQAAPMRISNSGRYFSVTELGHVYDPLFWDPNGTQANVLDQPKAWTLFDDMSFTATPNAFFTGGHTLRIGRPEHTLFRPRRSGGTQPHRRLCASTLLDLFHCGISTVGSVQDPEKGEEHLRDLTGPLIEINGHVNVNTASREVLRAVMAGGLKTDPWIANATASGQAADSLVEAILRGRPYLSTAEVAERACGINAKPILGDAKQLSLFGGGVEWNDSAAEEVFARLYNSTTVRSRHFRVFITGQAVRPRRSDPSQLEVLSTRSRLVHVFVEPLRDPTTGLIHDQRILITHEQDL